MSAPENAVVDYYSTLGVPATASLVEIKQAYRVLVLALHPDKNPLDAITTDTKQVDSHARIQRIIEAYRTLSDEQSRETYDHHRQQEQGEHRARRPWLQMYDTDLTSPTSGPCSCCCSSCGYTNNCFDR